MQQDRHPTMKMTGRHLSRDTRTGRRMHRKHQARRTGTLSLPRPGTPAHDAARKRLLSAKEEDARLRASTAAGKSPASVRCAARVHRLRVMRGAALLDVMFTLTALMAGAQGFAHWQAAGGMSSAELVTSQKAIAMAMPSPACDDRACVEHRRLPASGAVLAASPAPSLDRGGAPMPSLVSGVTSAIDRRS
ncbi:hypothetical protein [Pandoraea anhela]|nr:hypothetical protein [Pandoraea anhela]